ncbi:hypothetical protein B0H15DRAFT_1020744 [Mycena belliarum]|uniref:Uncharacterized protein n=1 Tax=Mycena belliarum TaxID=1033014 RepID=A0AAD6XT12_9AGAR|nr:hypothetical protein B0H15DRAFT_1020744 [Mycena belliae]
MAELREGSTPILREPRGRTLVAHNQDIAYRPSYQSAGNHFATTYRTRSSAYAPLPTWYHWEDPFFTPNAPPSGPWTPPLAESPTFSPNIRAPRREHPPLDLTASDPRWQPEACFASRRTPLAATSPSSHAPARASFHCTRSWRHRLEPVEDLSAETPAPAPKASRPRHYGPFDACSRADVLENDDQPTLTAAARVAAYEALQAMPAIVQKPREAPQVARSEWSLEEMECRTTAIRNRLLAAWHTSEKPLGKRDKAPCRESAAVPVRPVRARELDWTLEYLEQESEWMGSMV